MKSKILKQMSLFAGLVVLASCAGQKDDKKNNVVPTVGPQGHIQAVGSENKFCDINDGQIICSYRDPNTQALCSIRRAYDVQNMSNFCEQMRAIHNEASLPNGCNVQEVSSRILTENCSNFGGVNPPNTNPNWPNPNMPGSPVGPFPSGRIINCSVVSNGSYPTTLMIPAGSGRGFAFTTLNERRGGVAGFFGFSRKLGDVRVNYQPTQGRTPETLTVVVNYKDRAGKGERNTVSKHSGFAGSELKLDTMINGSQITVECNKGMVPSAPINESGNLVCTGNSHVTGSTYQRDIQFIKPINSFVAGEEVVVSEGIRISLNKATSMLTVHTVADGLLGPNMSSSSSLRSDLLVEASEPIGKAKMTCSIR